MKEERKKTKKTIILLTAFGIGFIIGTLFGNKILGKTNNDGFTRHIINFKNN